MRPFVKDVMGNIFVLVSPLGTHSLKRTLVVSEQYWTDSNGNYDPDTAVVREIDITDAYLDWSLDTVRLYNIVSFG
jgi:hypothetical protein